VCASAPVLTGPTNHRHTPKGTIVADVLDARVRELRRLLDAKSQEQNAILDSVTGKGTEDDPLVIKPEQQAAFVQLTEDMKAISTEMESIIEAKGLHELAQRLHAPAADPVAVAAAAVKAAMGEGDVSLPPTRIGEAFTESAEFKAMVAAGKFTMDTPFAVKGDITKYARKDVYSTMPDGDIDNSMTPGVFGRRERDPLVEQPRRPGRVRDLFPARRTTAAVIEFFRVTGFTNNASPVAERNAGNTAFAAKPQSGLAFDSDVAPVRTIAHWEAAHRSALADEPQLQSIIEGELLYGLRLQEDYQILQGAGTGEDLLGILNTPGIQALTQNTSPSIASDNEADAIRRAITKVALSYYEATGVVVHPNNWEAIELTKSQGDEKLYLFVQSISDGGPPRVWRLPVVSTQAIPENTGLVGAFGVGSQLYDREDGNIRVAEQHSDFFVRNAVVILAEERLALATKRPEAFCEVTFTP
jgi:HK97 family phage major capsid protein